VTFHVFVTSPRAGVPFAVDPYTVECKEVYATREQAQAFADAKTLNPGVIELLDAMPSVHPAWAAGQSVGIGIHRAYNAATWRCIQAHTTQVTWEPPNVPALWTMVPLPGASAWAQPVTYSLPSRCTYNGRLYNLLQAHTSQAAWNPPAVPALWADIGPATGEAAYTRAFFWVVGSDEPDYTQVERAKEAA
jgi:hypothetical protein